MFGAGIDIYTGSHTGPRDVSELQRLEQPDSITEVLRECYNRHRKSWFVQEVVWLKTAIGNCGFRLRPVERSGRAESSRVPHS